MDGVRTFPAVLLLSERDNEVAAFPACLTV